MANIIKHLVVNISETIGDKLLLLNVRPYQEYKEGVRGEQIGLTFTVLSEHLEYEKIDIKIEGLMEIPFDFDGTPVPVIFQDLQGKAYQDWNNKGEVKLSIKAKNISLLTEKRIKIGGDKA